MDKLLSPLKPARRLGRFLSFAATLLAASVAAPAQPNNPTMVTITGNVFGASGSHPVYVALWDAKGFLTRPAQQFRIDPGHVPSFRFRVTPGRWALSAYEDENENGVLDMGAFGPKEPSGFWHPFHGWRKPHFDDVSIEISHDVADATIQLGK